MGSINDTPAYKGINWSHRLNKLNAKEYSLIGNINIILEVIGKNGQNDHPRPEQKDHPLAGAN